jgi:DNA-binding PadR family transcriptional regulator
MPKCGAIREGSLYKRLRNLVNGGYVFDNPPNKSSRAKSFELSEKGHLALTARDVTMQELIVLADEIDSKDLNAVIKRILAKRKPPNRNHPF